MEEDVKKILNEHEKRLSELEKYLPKRIENHEKMAFENFAKEKSPKSNLEKALLIIYYIWSYENRNFIYDDIINFCKKLAWPTYSNPAMLIKELKRKRFIEEVGKNNESKREYRILEDGIKFVENNFKDVINERR